MPSARSAFASASDTSGSARGNNRERHTIVVDDFEAALAKAREEDKLLLVNFTGHT